MSDEINQILEFWYSEAMAKHWFNSTREIDQQIRDIYEPTWLQASEGKLDHWKSSANGCLALAIVLDQFPLNMYRGQAKSFSTEASAIAVAHHAIEQGFDRLIPDQKLAFLYMPLMHSENIQDQDLSVACFENAGLTENARFARHHREIVQRFGRFPHRNAILGRHSTEQELAYLASDEAFKG